MNKTYAIVRNHSGFWYPDRHFPHRHSVWMSDESPCLSNRERTGKNKFNTDPYYRESGDILRRSVNALPGSSVTAIGGNESPVEGISVGKTAQLYAALKAQHKAAFCPPKKVLM